MSEYFGDREDAEEFIIEWYAKDRKPPVFFGKIFNNGAEKWIVNYNAPQDPSASPSIKVLENHSNEIHEIVATPWPQRQQKLQRLRDREERQKNERAERERIASIKSRREAEKSLREAEGLCVVCGKSLGFWAKIFAITQHRGCSQFLSTGDLGHEDTKTKGHEGSDTRLDSKDNALRQEEPRDTVLTIKARNGGVAHTLGASQLGPTGTLSGAHLRGCDLIAAELPGADLLETDFEGANLAGANLRGANLRRANLLDATLANADLRDADLTGAGIAGAYFDGAHYNRRTLWPEGFDVKRHGHGAVLSND